MSVPDGRTREEIAEDVRRRCKGKYSQEKLVDIFYAYGCGITKKRLSKQMNGEEDFISTEISILCVLLDMNFSDFTIKLDIPEHNPELLELKRQLDQRRLLEARQSHQIERRLEECGERVKALSDLLEKEDLMEAFEQDIIRAEKRERRAEDKKQKMEKNIQKSS